MNEVKKTSEKDWTKLLTDPVLVGHIGKLLQAYREAAPEQREEALVAAMRKIRREAAAPVTVKTAGVKATAVATHVEPEKAQISGVTAAAATATTRAVAPAVEPAKQEKIPAATPESSATVSSGASSAVRPPFAPDLFTPSFGQDRRAYPRLRCFIAVELRSEGWDAPVWGNLANVSAGGCFIETLEPVRKNTKLEIGLWANNGKVWAKGIVINGVVTENNPTFGVRLKYTNMNADDRDTLRFFLKCVEDTTKSYEKQNGYLAQLKR